MIDLNTTRNVVPLPQRLHLGPAVKEPCVVMVRGVAHHCVQSEGYTTTMCVHCKHTGVRTKAGHRVTTRFRCSVCTTPLCKERGCFVQFHAAQPRMSSGDDQYQFVETKNR
ncbi:hypothetical protein KP79_PYT18784 [Mizuhopecten yessoensis]|uniref:PiggyBac transposable element-derived protein 4 C-terminal zinc-ribbon domain-containing protein n=1 Tax=Mizuhopecten yessoensis TaxID=6573 RepID=A0A210Q3F0_MIZYE|nr:hypothetical protein KP79_PYT18784 [Mizuhopecten yessoensis]